MESSSKKLTKETSVSFRLFWLGYLCFKWQSYRV